VRLQRRGYQAYVYAYKSQMSEKYTGFRWRKLSFTSNMLDLHQVPRKPQRSLAGVMRLCGNELTGDISAGLMSHLLTFLEALHVRRLVRVLLLRPAQPSSVSRSLLTSASVMPALRK
jgi:hypothetical protein